MPANTTRYLKHYRTMLRIRLFEEAVLRGFRNGQLRGTTHVCIGQEAVASGACAALEDGDLVTSNHRGHGHMLAKGADMQRMMAELYGKREGYSRGIGGSQHMAAAEVGFLGSNGITGGGLPLATGAGLALKLEEKNNIVLSFCGDGATAQGTFHESLNLATIWKLPVIFLIENNHYAMGTRSDETCPEGDLARRATGYGISGVKVDGNDPLAVEEAVTDARRHALAGDGPALIEAVTYRQHGHSRSDGREYISEEELKHWQQREPVLRLCDNLRQSGVEQEEMDTLVKEVEEEVAAAVEFATAGTPLSPDEYLALPKNKPQTIPHNKHPEGELTCGEAIYQALSNALEFDSQTLLMGEDIADYGGAFKITRGLYQRFGKDRVRNTPISENTIVGSALGAAMCGMRPVAEIMFMDFILLALDQIVNHAAKFTTVYADQFPLGLTLRTPAGGRRGYGATHSQCFESLLMHIPGLKIYTPASVQDHYDLLTDAIFDDSPVVVVEHKLLYGSRGEYDPTCKLPPGKSRIVQEGTDLTIVTYSHMVTLALEGARHLQESGISAEVIDLRTLAPLDWDTIAESANRTQRVMIAEEGHLTGGVGAEIGARLQELCFGYLDAPVLRVAAADRVIPTEEMCERAVLPQVGDIINTAQRLLEDAI